MIKEIINEFYSKEEIVRDRTTFSATEALNCKRKLYYEFKKVPKLPKDPRINRILDNGNFVHNRLISVLKVEKLLLASEITTPENSYNIKGRADAIIKLNQEKIIVEIKSINNKGFKELENLGKPNKYNEAQLQTYLFLFKIDKGIILYESKDSNELLEFLINFDLDLVDKILAHFKSTKEYIDKNILPPREFASNSMECKFCLFNEECWKESWM